MKTTYSERDYAFGQRMLTLRDTIGLTQKELAEHLGVSRRAVSEWESGGSYPKAEHLKQFIELGVQHQAFPAAHEAEEIRRFWKASRQKVLLNEQWLSTLLNTQHPSQQPITPPLIEEASASNQVMAPSTPEQRVDWGEALAITTFYGRERELDLLTRWIVQDHCRAVSVLGMGGIGKSALTVSVMHRLAEHFQVVIFRSVRDAPSCETLLDDCLQVLSPQPLDTVPASLEGRISLLLDLMRTVRALVVLDNLESLLEAGKVTGRYHPGFEGYERMLRRVATTDHQSCLLLTSREKPVELRPLEGKRLPVRSVRLAGLEISACEQLLAENGVVGTPQDWERLAEVYTGNPLALKIVAETIADLFGGEIHQFLSEGAVIFGSISDLLSEQFARLSSLEQTMLYWLAIVREPVTLDELQALLVTPLSRVQMLESMDGLRRRSLIERGQRQGSFTLQSVVLEYVTEALITEMIDEIQHGQLDRFIQHALVQAHTREYVRQTQERLLVAPTLTRLQNVYQGQAETEVLLLSQLDQLRELADEAQGYGPANVMALLRMLCGHLRGLDLSRLTIRDAYLQGIEMQDTSLVGSMLHDTLFTEALHATWSVAISSTGQYWAVGSWRGEVRVWREGGRRLHLVWQAHTENAFTLAFSPDERTLASGSWDGTIKLWEVQSGALLWTGWHTDLVLSVAFSPDGLTLASAGNDAIIQLWDVSTSKHLQTLMSQGGGVYAVAWSPDRRLLASGSSDGSIQLWQIQGDLPATSTLTLMGHTNWVHSLAFSPDGSQLVSGSWDSTVKLWDVANSCVLQTLTGHRERVYSVAWSPDGRTVASASFDKTIWLWDVAQNQYRAALHGHTSAVYNLAFTPDGRRLLSSSEDSTLRMWDVISGQCLRTIEGYAVSLYDLDWSPDGMQLASGSTDGRVIIWQVTGKMPPRVLQAHNWVVMGVAWSPDGQWLVTSGWDGTIRLWEPTTEACLHVLRDPDRDDTLFHAIAWHPDGRLLASGSYLYGVHVWDMPARRRRWVGRTTTNQTAFLRVAWSPDGTRLAAGGDDGSVCLWDTATGTLLLRLTEHQGLVKNVAFSPDGTMLVSAGGGKSNGELFLWNAQSGERLRTFEEHPGMVYAVVWTPSGDQLVSGSSDGMLRWLDVQSGECLRKRAAHQKTIQSLKISPDDQMLASCGDDGAIMIWDLDSGEHLRTLRQDRPYERLDITGIRGLTEAQKATLLDLGAIEAKTAHSTMG
jgi:WD40 repeat protein/transcriptional regulator with XRE-family HTH domain